LLRAPCMAAAVPLAPPPITNMSVLMVCAKDSVQLKTKSTASNFFIIS
jgi:hypothetical protein